MGAVPTTETAQITKDEEGIVRVVYKQDMKIDLAAAKANMAGQLQLRDSAELLLLLVDTRNVKSISREAREYFAGHEATSCTAAMALIVDSWINKTMGNFFISVSKPQFPTRLFSSETESLSWLRSHRDG